MEENCSLAYQPCIDVVFPKDAWYQGFAFLSPAIDEASLVSKGREDLDVGMFGGVCRGGGEGDAGCDAQKAAGEVKSHDTNAFKRSEIE